MGRQKERRKFPPQFQFIQMVKRRVRKKRRREFAIARFLRDDAGMGETLGRIEREAERQLARGRRVVIDGKGRYRWVDANQAKEP